MKEVKIDDQYYCELKTNFKPVKHLKKKQRNKYYVVNWGCIYSKLKGALKKRYKYINIYKFQIIEKFTDINLCRQIMYNTHKRGYKY